jgi:hypothetical protein
MTIFRKNHRGPKKRGQEMACLYEDYEVETFEAGRGLWHARIRRADLGPLLIDGALFPKVEVGFAWPDQDAAIADAKRHIDLCKDQWVEPRQV